MRKKLNGVITLILKGFRFILFGEDVNNCKVKNFNIYYFKNKNRSAKIVDFRRS